MARVKKAPDGGRVLGCQLCSREPAVTVVATHRLGEECLARLEAIAKDAGVRFKATRAAMLTDFVDRSLAAKGKASPRTARCPGTDEGRAPDCIGEFVKTKLRKRCPACAAEQHRLNVRAAGKRHKAKGKGTTTKAARPSAINRSLPPAVAEGETLPCPGTDRGPTPDCAGTFTGTGRGCARRCRACAAEQRAIRLRAAGQRYRKTDKGKAAMRRGSARRAA